jgi:threonine dehydrogenase-like Zn-dependent dehydrogenase
VRALVKDEPGFGLKLKNVPEPVVGPGEVLLRPYSCGICGSDLSKYQWREHQQNLRLPIVIGHEFAGVVEAVGEGVTDVRLGDRVAVEPFTPCQECYLCRTGSGNLCQKATNLGTHRDGAMAELVTVPARSLLPIGPGVSGDMGAMLEPLAVAVHTMNRSGIRPGESVCIIGPGPIGLLHLLVFKATASRVTVVGTESDAHRLEIARRLGADVVLSNGEPKWKESARGVLGDAPGYDIVVESAGHPDALLAALDLTRPGGRTVVTGSFNEVTPLKPHSMLKHREVTMIGSKGRHREDWMEAIRLVESKAVDPMSLVDLQVPLSDAVAGFEAAADRRAMKVLVQIAP